MIISVNWSKAKSANSEDKLKTELAKRMDDTKKENKKVFELLTEISKGLGDKGFSQLGLSYSPEKREFTVQVKDEHSIEKSKKSIENFIVHTAKKNDFKNYKVNFLSLDHDELSEEDVKSRESMSEIAHLTSKLLEENGYNRTHYSMTDKEILIEIVDGNLINREEIEELIENAIFSKTSRRFTVTIKEENKNQILDQQWQPIFSAIIDETRKEFKEYRGFAYSFHPKPLQIIIKTNLDNRKWFGNSDRAINQIENYIEKIITLKRAELAIEEIPYEIIIRDKDDKQVN